MGSLLNLHFSSKWNNLILLLTLLYYHYDSYIIIDNVLYSPTFVNCIHVHCFKKGGKTGNGGKQFSSDLPHGDGPTLTKLKKADV